MLGEQMSVREHDGAAEALIIDIPKQKCSAETASGHARRKHLTTWTCNGTADLPRDLECMFGARGFMSQPFQSTDKGANVPFLLSHTFNVWVLKLKTCTLASHHGTRR